MSLHTPFFSSRRRMSLTVRISALLIAAVVLPLLITVIGSEVILRPTLTNQAISQMRNDAQSHVQAIDSLLIADEHDLGVLGQYFSIQQFLAGNQFYMHEALEELAMGNQLAPDFSDWTLFSPQGQTLLSYPAPPTSRGQYIVPPELITQLLNPHKTLNSYVYFDGNEAMAYVDIYTLITSSQKKIMGIGRATLSLTATWTAVNNESNAASGSYAMVVDGHGVRIAYTNPDATLTTLPTALFKAIAPLPAAFQQQIKKEDLYGNNYAAVTELADPALVNQLSSQQGSSAFQLTPALQAESFQAYAMQSEVVPWTYIVLRPVNTITGAANQQDIYTVLLVVAITVLAAIVGLLIGRSTTHPILRSVSLLTTSSQMLRTLSTREQSTATEQQWIVESAQTGLNSSQYYARASSTAAHKLMDKTNELGQKWDHLDAAERQRLLYQIMSAATYLERAASHQERTSKNLSTAMQITSQVTKQLLTGATSASEAASQMEEVIEQLRNVVG